MKKINVIRSLVGLLILVTTTACTRKGDGGSRIAFNMDRSLSHPANYPSSKVSNLAVPVDYYASHLVVNFHYDGKVAKFDWDCPFIHGQHSMGADPSLCEFPAQVNFNNKDFPPGNGRELQILLVYENSQGKMLFYYDDEAAIVLAPNATKSVLVGEVWKPQGTATSGMAHVSGRYGSTLSGYVEGSLNPSNALVKKPLKIFDNYINAGWFNFMYISGVNFIYKHKDSGKIFFAGKTIDNIKPLAKAGDTLPATNAVLALKVPSYYSAWSEGYGSNFYTSEVKTKEDVVVGFWDDSGNPLINNNLHSLSVPTASVDITGAYHNVVAGNLVNPISADGLDWMNPVSPNAVADESAWASYLLKFDMGSTDVNKVIRGTGLAIANANNATACNDIDEFTPLSNSCINLFPDYIKQEGIAPFKGAFVVKMSGNMGGQGEALQTFGDNSNLEIDFTLVPGAAGHSVNGVDVYAVEAGSTEMFHNGAPCRELAEANGMAANVAESLASTPMYVPASFYLANLNIDDSTDDYIVDLSSHINDLTDQAAVVCPYKMVGALKQYHPNAVYNYGFYSGGGGGGGGSIATEISIDTLGSYWSLNTGACLPVLVNLVDGSGQMASSMTSTLINLSLNDDNGPWTTGDFYTHADCGSPGDKITSLNFNSYEIGPKMIFVKLNSTTATNLQLVALDDNAVLSPGIKAIVNITSNSASTLDASHGLALLVSSNVYAHQCTPIDIISLDVNGVPADAAISAYNSLRFLDNSGGGNFYSSMQDCENDGSITTYGGIMYSGYDTFGRIYYKKNTPGGVNITVKDIGNTIALVSQPITVQAPGAVSYADIRIDTHNDYLHTGICYQIKVGTYDMYGHHAGVPSTEAITLTGNNVEFSNNSNCSGSGPSISSNFTTGAIYPVDSLYVRILDTSYSVEVQTTNYGMAGFDDSQYMADQTFVKLNTTGGYATASTDLTIQLVDSYGGNLDLSWSSATIPFQMSFTATGGTPNGLGFSDCSTPGPNANANFAAGFASNSSIYLCLPVSSAGDIDFSIVTSPGIMTDSNFLSNSWIL